MMERLNLNIFIFVIYYISFLYSESITFYARFREIPYYSAPSEEDEKLRVMSLMSEFRNEALLNTVLITVQWIRHNQRFYKPALKYGSFRETAECNKGLLIRKSSERTLIVLLKVTLIRSKIYGPLGRLRLLIKALKIRQSSMD
jgi:hypothetical protein